MFPFDIDLDELDLDMEEQEEEVYKEYEIDFTTGQLTGRIVEGAEACRVYAWMALQVERYNYEQYSWDYGHEFSNLIGQSDRQLVKMEGERYAREALMVNPHITGVKDFEIEIDEDKIQISMTIETEYGEVDLNV